MKYSFLIPLEGVAKERARISVWGGKTPKKTAEFERSIGWAVRSKYRGAPLTGALRVSVKFYFQKKLNSKLIYPHRDIDNLLKSVFDGLNEVLWLDDKQIVSVFAEKLFVADKSSIFLEVETDN